jgi:hypothetical protein
LLGHGDISSCWLIVNIGEWISASEMARETPSTDGIVSQRN